MNDVVTPHPRQIQSCTQKSPLLGDHGHTQNRMLSQGSFQNLSNRERDRTRYVRYSKSRGAVLSLQRLAQFLTNRRMVHISQLAPIWEPIVVTANPLDRLFLQETVVFPGGFLYPAKVYHSLVPGLSQNCNCQISFGAEVRLMSSYLGAVREAFESHRAIIA